jgi:hypothetical protein
MLKVEEPVFFSVTIWVALVVPTGKLPKDMLVGLTVAVPELVLRPEPVSETP